MIDETNKAIVDFSRAVSLQPNFPVAHVQKLYTDYRAASSIGDHTTINSVLQKFNEATEKFPKCVETWALYAQVMNDQQVRSSVCQYPLICLVSGVQQGGRAVPGRDEG